MLNSTPKFKKVFFGILAAVIGLIIIVIVVGFLATNYLGTTGQLAAPGYYPLAGSVDFYDSSEKAIGGVAQNVARDSAPEVQTADRKIIKNGSLELLVGEAEKTAREIQEMAERLGGFVTASNVYEITGGAKTGSVTVRVPAGRFDEALGEIKKLAIKVEREQTNAQDITEQYIDLEARLKNLQAEEVQYQEIMKKAVKIEDILNVASRLADVRGRIEQIEGQLKYLSRQVDMAVITAQLTEEADVEVLGLRWRPLVVIKQGLRNMFVSLQGYVDAMIGFVFRLPVIVAWLVTIGLILLVVWKICFWVWRRFLKAKEGVE